MSKTDRNLKISTTATKSPKFKETLRGTKSSYDTLLHVMTNNSALNETNNLLDYRHLASESQPCRITQQNIVLLEKRLCIHAQKWRCPCESVYSLLYRCRNSTIFGRCIMDSSKNILPRLFQLTPIDFKDEPDEVKLIVHCLWDFTLLTVAGAHEVPFVVPFTSWNAHRKRTCDNSF